jgi:hypothetical protein
MITKVSVEIYLLQSVFKSSCCQSSVREKDAKLVSYDSNHNHPAEPVDASRTITINIIKNQIRQVPEGS